MAAPQDKDRTNTTRFKAYVSDTITAHKNDPRVLWWGLFNEPHSSKGSFSSNLRHAAYGWAKAINPTPALITSLWTCAEGGGPCAAGDLNPDSDLHNIHTYDTNFADWTAQINQGMAAKRPSIVTEAGCRWFQGSNDAGSPLEVINYANALVPTLGKYVPGLMMAWTVFAANDNTRWHWDSPKNTPEPAIPWCGLLWPDGYPVSMTEITAIAEWTASPAFTVLPQRLYMDTFLPTELSKIGRDVTLVIAPEPGGGNGSVSTAFNYSVPPSPRGFLVEAAVWPSWSKGAGTQVVGLLLGGGDGKPLSGIFAGVTNTGSIVLESWANGVPTPFASYDLSRNPGHQAKAAVDGWNMMRVREVGGSIQVWFNPTHADVAAPPASRGMRIEATLQHDMHLTGKVSAAARGGAGLQVDYVGVFACKTQNVTVGC